MISSTVRPSAASGIARLATAPASGSGPARRSAPGGQPVRFQDDPQAVARGRIGDAQRVHFVEPPSDDVPAGRAHHRPAAPVHAIAQRATEDADPPRSRQPGSDHFRRDVHAQAERRAGRSTANNGRHRCTSGCLMPRASGSGGRSTRLALSGAAHIVELNVSLRIRRNVVGLHPRSMANRTVWRRAWHQPRGRAPCRRQEKLPC